MKLLIGTVAVLLIYLIVGCSGNSRNDFLLDPIETPYGSLVIRFQDKLGFSAKREASSYDVLLRLVDIPEEKNEEIINVKLILESDDGLISNIGEWIEVGINPRETYRDQVLGRYEGWLIPFKNFEIKVLFNVDKSEENPTFDCAVKIKPVRVDEPSSPY